jgi:hypothetical protein
MTQIASILLVVVTCILFWSSLGCLVTALRLRYYPLLALGVFFLLIGWGIASLEWLPAAPLWFAGGATILLALYKWLEAREQQGHPRTIPIKQVLLWWANPHGE